MYLVTPSAPPRVPGVTIHSQSNPLATGHKFTLSVNHITALVYLCPNHKAFNLTYVLFYHNYCGLPIANDGKYLPNNTQQRGDILYKTYNNWKARLAHVGKTQQDLIVALLERGHEVKQSALSQWVSGAKKPRESTLLAEIEIIIIKWEKENGKTHCIKSPQDT